MKPGEEDETEDPVIWSKYKDIVEKADGREYSWSKLGRDKFLEEAKKAIAIVQTGEDDTNASIILTKGNIMPPPSQPGEEKEKVDKAPKKKAEAKDKVERVEGKKKDDGPSLEELKKTLALLQDGERESK
jgi:hypothetical protein